MNDELRQRIIERLKRGEDLPREWAREIFPPEKVEYELVYHGKEREGDILANTMAVPLQEVRTFGKNGGAHSTGSGQDRRNMLILGDNLQVLKRLLEYKKEGRLCNADSTPGVRLVYIDPPFGTGDEYGGNDAEIAYSAKKQGTEFIDFVRKRLVVLRELLSDDGSICVRLDYHFGHYIKVVMDEIFGLQNFQNEVVINRVKRQLRNLTRLNVSTESIFFYSRSSSFYFSNPESPRVCNFCGREKDPIWDDMVSPGLRNPPERIIFGKKYLPRRGRHFMYTQEKIDELEKQGRLRINPDVSYYDLNGKRIIGRPEYLQTENVPVDTNWTDIRGYAYTTDYPTENHEELLERVIKMGSKEGDIVLDCFAGSGTTLAVAEKLGRRWIGIDRGKLAIYTIQKRMLNLKKEIGNKGKPLTPKPFTLYNAGLYDFATLRQLPREDWRFFALQLFECKDEPHTIGGLKLDGKRRGGSVLVYDHHNNPDAKIDEEAVLSIHRRIGDKISRHFYIIAPRHIFAFQQDYLTFDSVRYYALRIPYSFINELHRREFSALQQPKDETAVNDLIDAEGFDFIQPPTVKYKAGVKKRPGQLLKEAYIKLESFESKARVRGALKWRGMDAFSMLLLDLDYSGEVFQLHTHFYAKDIEAAGWHAWFPVEAIGEKIMAVFMDIYGNEATRVITRDELKLPTQEE